MNLCDLKTIRQLMNTFHLNFRKELGQNFLTDLSVVEDIADGCCDEEGSTILEIGPGIGTLTQELCARYKQVISLEIDRGLIPVLAFTMKDAKNFTLVNEDVMKADLPALLSPAFAAGPVSVAANLPYYITTPILMKLLESGLPFDNITVMIQSEVADRLCAPAGGKDCGAITAVVGYYGKAEKLFTVTADHFVPAPKVDSTVIRISLYKERPWHPVSEALMFQVIKAAFEQRRKTLLNALSHGFPQISKEALLTAIEGCGHRADIRGEKLSVTDFVVLSDKLNELL